MTQQERQAEIERLEAKRAASQGREGYEQRLIAIEKALAELRDDG